MSTSHALRCDECGARLAYDQRYCVECGARCGPLAPALAELIGVGPAAGLGRRGEAGNDPQQEDPPGQPMPSSLVSGIAVMALLAFGVLLGSGLSPVQESAATAPIVVAVAPSTTASNQPPSAAASTPPPPSAPEATPAGGHSRDAGKHVERRPDEHHPDEHHQPASAERTGHARAAADLACLPDRAVRSGLQRGVRSDFAGELPVKDAHSARASCSTTTTR